VTINRKTRNTEPEIGTDRSSQTRENPRVDRYGSGFGPPRRCGSDFWTVLEPNRTVYPVQTRTAGGLPGPVANTTPTPPSTICVSTTHSCRLPLFPSTTPYINIFWKYSVLFKLSSRSGLWTADTWAMSADTQLCDSGQWTPRDRRWQFWPFIPEVWTPRGKDRKLYCAPYITYL